MRRNAHIYDIDGTLANTDVYLHYIRNLKNDPNFVKDYDAYHKATMNAEVHYDVLDMMKQSIADGYDVIIMTSRREQWRPETVYWLTKHNIPHHALFMRDNNDERGHRECKNSLYNTITPYWNICFAIDDNEDIVNMWKEYGINTIHYGSSDLQ